MLISVFFNFITNLPVLVQIIFFILVLNIIIGGFFYFFTRLTEKDDIKSPKRSNK